MEAFELTQHDLGYVRLQPLTAESAQKLGEALAAIPPWSVIGWPPERMVRGLKREQASVKRFEVLAGEKLAGIITIQDPFLHGPYLQLLAVLPEFQGQNLGLRLLQWMELRRAARRPGSSGFACPHSTDAPATSMSASGSRQLQSWRSLPPTRPTRCSCASAFPMTLPADHDCTSSTVLPRTLPARICWASASASLQECV